MQETLPPHPHQHPITPLNTHQVLHKDPSPVRSWTICVIDTIGECVCVCVLIDTSRVCCEPGLCAGALTVLLPSLLKWCRGEDGGLLSSAVTSGCRGREEGRRERLPKRMTAFPSGLPLCQQIWGVRRDEWYPCHLIGSEEHGWRHRKIWGQRGWDAPNLPILEKAVLLFRFGIIDY